MVQVADSWRTTPNVIPIDKSKEQVSEIDTEKKNRPRVTSNVSLPGKITIVNTKSAESSPSQNENAESSVSK